MKLVIAAIALLVLVLAGCTTQEDTTGNVVAENSGEFVKEFSFDAFNFDFKTNNVQINKGDKVRIKLTSSSGTHGISIPDLGINIPPVSPGQEQVVEFVAEQSGEFEYYCNIMCGPGHHTMRSSFTIQ